MKISIRFALAAAVVCVAVWLGWALLTPVGMRIATSALLRWCLVAIPALTLLLIAAWAICRSMRLPALAHPLLAGLIAAALAWAMAQALLFR